MPCNFYHPTANKLEPRDKNSLSVFMYVLVIQVSGEAGGRENPGAMGNPVEL